ncbi:hypothetical protein A0H81_03333 [Grifola frondosa]|uniref:Uncharacterized protein n=1 Tax=Grifola frondosa TaxID=5627 RepID=A0A1C7MGT9_GRIFR|nr:hypothetical protein A0H81_03333 [Grifola frondosa]
MFPTSETTPDAEAPALFPSLKRLHVIVVSGGNTRQIVRTLPLLAPNLSHLRFSGARGTHSFLLEFLRNAMGMPPPVDIIRYYETIQPPPGSDPNVRPSYPSLQYIIVHTALPPQCLGTSRMQYKVMVSALDKMEMACRGQVEGVQFIILKGRGHLPRYWAERAKKDWLECMTGQRGCWTLQHGVEGSRWTVDHYDDSDDDVC